MSQMEESMIHGTIKDRLLEHLTGAGTMNDSTTDALYREAHGIPDHEGVDLEAIEAWAQAVANS